IPLVPILPACTMSLMHAPDAETLLALLADTSVGLLTCAHELGLSLPELEARTQSPDFQAALAQLERLAALRAHIVSLQSRPAAIARLTQLAADATTLPEPARKAATTLLRTVPRPSHPPTPPTPPVPCFDPKG